MTQVATRNGFRASTYQEAIFQAVRQGTRDIVVSAVAGSGKSTTLKYLLDHISATLTILYCCFNSDAQKSLNAKIVEYSQTKAQRGEKTPVAECSTIHSLGNRTITLNVGKCQIKSNKYSTLVRQYLLSHMADYDSQLAQQVNKLVDMVRLTLTPATPDGLEYVINRFEIDILPEDEETWPVVCNCVSEVLKAGMEVAKINREIDFTDMIWLPSSQALNLAPKQYDWVLVDEAQDLSPAQRELVLKARKKSGRMIFVGDRSQAIYGFAGASLRSIDEIIEATNAVEMPLSICYRCPKKVIAKANEIYPGTEAAPDAEDGIVESIVKEKVADMVQPGDLILCRLTAPLVEMCLQFLREGKRANVRGKDLGSQFTSLLNAMEKKYKAKFHIDLLIEIARDYEAWQVGLLSLNAEENEMKIASLQDKIDTLVALYEAYKARENGHSSIDGFKSYIEAFFAEDKDAQIILSTGHRAKGLEYPRVFILGWDNLPHPKAKTLDQITQERNLMYVMVTRAQKALYLVQAHVPATIEEPVISPEKVIEAPAIVETVNDTAPTKQAVKKGRKALDEADKRVVFQQMWDANLKNFFNAQAEEKGLSASELLEELLLSHPTFGPAFQASEDGKAYADRQQRAEERREKAYKGRKRTKKADEGPEDDGPNGGGWNK